VPLSRRVLLGGGVAGLAAAAGVAALVEQDVLPGRSLAYETLGLNGEDGVVPDVPPGPRVEGVLRSAYVARPPAWRISYPPGARPGDHLPVAVGLHGAGGTAASWCDNLGAERFLAASGWQYALAFVDGGATSFWHERTSGEDPRTMVREEFLPLLADRGLRTDDPGLVGWSMGGLGALVLGADLADAGQHPAVLAVSPALWPSYDQTMPEAFDTSAQYDGCAAAAARGLDLGVRVDCGTGDPFYPDVRDVLDEAAADGGRRVETHWAPGAHDVGYWTRVLPDELDWLGERLSAGRA
jgi:S-formylglutathione hydrolase FrmB